MHHRSALIFCLIGFKLSSVSGMLLPWVKRAAEIPLETQKVQELKATNRLHLAALSKDKLLEIDQHEQEVFEATFGPFPHAS